MENGQTVDSSNVVSTLLDGVYRATDDPAEQDRVFASAARSIFDTLLTGGGNPAQALGGLVQAAGERRVLVGSADASEREELSETVLAGRFLSGSTPSDTRPRVGLFLNDSGNDKMTYYLRTKVSVRSLTCYPDGAQDVEVTARLTNTAPRGGEGLPDYVVGGNPEIGIPRGVIRVTAYAFAPEGGDLDAMGVDDQSFEVPDLDLADHPVAPLTVDIDPQSARTVHFTIRTAAGSHGPVDLWTTPGIGDVSPVVKRSTCST